MIVKWTIQSLSWSDFFLSKWSATKLSFAKPMSWHNDSALFFSLTRMPLILFQNIHSKEGATTFSITTFSIVTINIMTFSIMTFSRMTFSIMTFSIMTFSIMTFSIMTFSITTFSIMIFSTTINQTRHKHNDTHHNGRVLLCSVSLILSLNNAECCK